MSMRSDEDQLWVEQRSKLAARAREYTDLITDQNSVNAMGQHVHPVYGRSDVMLMKMIQQFGSEDTQKALELEFKERQNARP